MESSAINAVGVWFYSASTDRYLYVMRADRRHANHWALPGGKQNAGESLLQTINRECREELGSMPDCRSMIPLEQFTNDTNSFTYHTFFSAVAREFVPRLNNEHVGYAWINSGCWPRPMHPGLWATVNFDVIQQKLDMLRSGVPQGTPISST
jgi:8-oxo-dGTP pyrophosphatase MutT (NUDIX family)